MASPEASTAYLERFNFKTLMEWLTARVILHRPDDPMVFCRDLLERNIEERGGNNTPYDSACAPRLLKGCYDDAMNAADEHGVIHPEACCHPITGNKKKGSVPAAGGSNNSGEKTRAPANDRSVSKPSSIANDQTPVAAVEKEAPPAAGGDAKTEQLATAGVASSAVAGEAIRPLLLSVLQDMCELARPEIAAAAIVAGACKAVNARRGAFFRVTNEAGELREIGAGSSSAQRVVKPGQGLMGKAAAAPAGVAVIVMDPSNEEAFCREVDLPREADGNADAAGECCPGLMYGPVKDGSGGTWGVLAVAEPANGSAFNEDSLHLFRAISEMASVSMRNSEVFGVGERGCDKFRNMVEVIEATNDRLGVNHLLYTIAKCLPVICDAQKCTCFLVDDDRDELWVVQGELNMRVPKSKGIVGAVATSGNAENISDVYADPRFNKEVDVETGFQTHSILAMPVRGGDKNKVIAVVQLINKQEEGGGTESSAAGSSYDAAAGQRFTAQDEVVIGAFLSLLGPHIFTSSISQFSRKVLIKVNTIGNEEIAFPEDRTLSMQPRQKSMGSLADVIDAEQSLQEEEEDSYEEDEEEDEVEQLDDADSNL